MIPFFLAWTSFLTKNHFFPLMPQTSFVAVGYGGKWFGYLWVPRLIHVLVYLSGVPDFFDRKKISSGGDLSHYQVPHCIRVFFYFVWFVFIHHNFQFYFELCTYCNILDIYQS